MRLVINVLSLTAVSLLSPMIQPAAVPPTPDTAASPFLRFSTAVAVAGDQILVGRVGSSVREDAPASGVHVFQRDKAGKWTEAAVLAPKDLAATDAFGTAIAVDGSLLAVGAPGSGDGHGAIYIFERDGEGRWTKRAKLAAAGASSDSLGQTVALNGGILVAGAPAHANNRGQAVVFRRGGDVTAWTEQATLQAPDASQAHRFGQALAIADGRMFISAPGGRYTKGVPGQVVVFRNSARSWIEEARVTVTNEPNSGGLGAALAAEGATFWASSPKNETVYEFHRDSAGRWTSVATIRRAASKGSLFGTAIARAGRDLIIGAPGENLSGTVYVFRSESSRAPWTEAQSFTAPEALLGPPDELFRGMLMSFGEKLAAGNGLLAVGVPRAEGGEGAVVGYRLESAEGRWQETSTMADTAWSPRKGRPLTGAVIACNAGKAYTLFDCQNVELLSYLPAAAIGGTASVSYGPLVVRTNGMWGWTDSTTQREFVLVGRVDGTAFVEVTDPINPKYLGRLPLHQGAEPSIWREIKVYKNYAFIVSDASGPHGMQIFDLTQLRDVTGPPATFQETVHYDRIYSAHNVVVDPESGYAYVVGSNGGGETCGGGLHMIDVRDPTHPVFVGCYAERSTGTAKTGYIHDAQCVTYRGPDTQYRGREICLNASETALGIADVTDKQHPKTISVISYPNVAYAHQGWLSEDGRYFFLNDEGDEGTPEVTRTRTIIFDVSKLSEPVVAKEFLGTTPATDHNLYIRGPYMYQANYLAGLRVIDVRDPSNPREVGYFDTTPATKNMAGYGGTWSNYPYFKGEKDGIVAMSSISEGLFLVRFKPPITAP